MIDQAKLDAAATQLAQIKSINVYLHCHYGMDCDHDWTVPLCTQMGEAISEIDPYKPLVGLCSTQP